MENIYLLQRYNSDTKTVELNKDYLFAYMYTDYWATERMLRIALFIDLVYSYKLQIHYRDRKKEYKKFNFDGDLPNEMILSLEKLLIYENINPTPLPSNECIVMMDGQQNYAYIFNLDNKSISINEHTMKSFDENPVSIQKKTLQDIYKLVSEWIKSQYDHSEHDQW